MLRLLNDSSKRLTFGMSRSIFDEIVCFGPFNCDQQRRWKKPTDSARTRLENRKRDLVLDKLMSRSRKLKLVMGVNELMSRRRGSYTSVQLLSRWRHMVGINIGIGDFLRKYPHVFDLFTHPVKMNLCCKLSEKMVELIMEEEAIVKECELDTVKRLKRLLMLSTDETLSIHGLWLIRRELGLPDDFRDTVLPKYPSDFRMLDPDTLALVSRDASLGVAEVEKWRKKEYEDKWLKEIETKYTFRIHFPTGFTFEKGFKEKLRNWQLLPYLKPYERKDAGQVVSVQRLEKRAVGILHELLCLTVEKMIEVERLSHFRRSFSMEVNVRELILKHPGIFYISTKGSTQTVFLREGYSKGCLVEPNPIYTVRRKMLDLVLVGCRNTSQVRPLEELTKRFSNHEDMSCDPCDGDWVIPILKVHDEEQNKNDASDMSD